VKHNIQLRECCDCTISVVRVFILNRLCYRTCLFDVGNKIEFNSFTLSSIKSHNSLVAVVCRLSLSVHRNLNLTAFIFNMGSV
jgi:hypothetical protein